AAAVERGAARPAGRAGELNGAVRSLKDLDRFLIVVEEIDHVEAASRAADLLCRRVGLLPIERRPLPVLIVGRGARREKDAPGGVLPVALDGLAGGGLRVG